LKNRNPAFLVCLVFGVMVIVWGMDRGAQAQSQPDMGLQPEQGRAAAPDEPDEAPLLKTQRDRVNYAIGVQLIGNFKRQGADIDLDLVIKGMQDACSGKGLLMSDPEVRRALVIYQDEVRRSRAKIRAISLEESRKKGEAFLAENRKIQGVIALPSGLQYRIIRSGEGRTPTDTDTVECDYRGTLIDGREFENSYRRGGPRTFKVEAVIPGWREALKRMPVGSKWQLFVPPQLAYGEKGTGSIQPGETLIFEIELLGIK